MDWKDWIGKIVFIKLKTGTIFTYSLVKSFDDDFLTIIDKFKKMHSIKTSEIERIGEENGKQN